MLPESALPALIKKMERAECSKSFVGLVVPTGYSFNLDSTNIYMTLAALFIAQACNVDLSIGQQLLLLGVAMLSSKGARGVTGAGHTRLFASRKIADTARAQAVWTIFPYLSLTGRYEHLAAGPALRRAGLHSSDFSSRAG